VVDVTPEASLARKIWFLQTDSLQIPSVTYGSPTPNPAFLQGSSPLARFGYISRMKSLYLKFIDAIQKAELPFTEPAQLACILPGVNVQAQGGSPPDSPVWGTRPCG
jgi:hypothetical protein